MGMVCILVDSDSNFGSSGCWALIIAWDHLLNIWMELFPIGKIGNVKLGVVWALGVNDDGALGPFLEMTKNSDHSIKMALSWSH